MREPDKFIANGQHERETVETLNEIFLMAANGRYADVHFEPSLQGDMRVRFRAPGGDLVEIARFSRDVGRVFDEKIRARARMSITDAEHPLSGRLRLRFQEEKHMLDVRVEVAPLITGSKIVCRMLDQANAGRRLSDIDMSEMVRDCIRQVIDEPHGLFIVTGPTGSGKTTTLYAIINELNDVRWNITTIENPVEYQVDGLNQINVSDVHLPFAAALRSVVRQDPDIIMVGEIRDAETAKIAVDAALTGHLVLTTLHANNSAMAATRLLELGVDPGTLSSALRGIVSQRLVRRLNREVEFEWARASDVELAWMRSHSIQLAVPSFPLVNDHPSSFDGYMPVIEMIVGDGPVRKAIARGPEAIYEAAARQPQFETLAHAGVRHATSGETSIGEVRRVTSSMDGMKIAARRLGDIFVAQGVASMKQVYEAAVRQTRLRRDGVMRPLGELLVDDGVCTSEQVIQAMGFSSDAEAVARRLVNLGRIDSDNFAYCVGNWKAGGGNLFTILMEGGFCTWEDLREATHIV